LAEILRDWPFWGIGVFGLARGFGFEALFKRLDRGLSLGLELV
jgi:hypothetical protein